MWFFDAIENMFEDMFSGMIFALILTIVIPTTIAFAINAIFGHFIGLAAKKKGHEYKTLFLITLFLGPIIGLIVLLIQGDDKQAIENQRIEQGDLKRCPFCAEPINKEAVLCKYCGRELRKTNPGNIAGENMNSGNHYKVVSISENTTELDSQKIQREIEMIDKYGNKLNGYRTEKKHKKREPTYKYFLFNGERIFNVEDNFIVTIS